MNFSGILPLPQYPAQVLRLWAMASHLTLLMFLASVAENYSMRKRTHVFFTGKVQGVGFRYSAREIACGFEVTGMIRNLPDGRVEMTAEGDEEEVKAFLEAIQVSHLAGYIRNTETRWSEATGEFTGFEIRS